MKEEARRLRSDGCSINEIATRTGMAKSTVSLLVRDLPLTASQERLLAGWDRPGSKRRLGQIRRSEICRQERRRAQAEGRRLVHRRDPDYFAGVMLYWAEGAKSRNVATLVNSDVELLRMWVRWVARWYDLPAQPRLRVNCFLGNGLALDEIEAWWLRELELPGSALRKSIVNRASRASKGVRRPLLHGTAAVTYGSTFLVQSIYGAIQEIGGFERPEWLDLGGAMLEDPADADGASAGVGG